jgi:hypothetical protein
MRMQVIAAVVVLAVLLTPSNAYTFKGDAVSYKVSPMGFAWTGCFPSKPAI